VNPVLSLRNDIDLIGVSLDLSRQQLADALGVPRASFDRYYYDKTPAPESFLNSLYGFAFRQKLALAEIKAAVAERELRAGEIPLFHGSRHSLLGEIMPKGKKTNEFGSGFYLGENYAQAYLFLYNHPNSNCYEFAFNPSGLTLRHFDLSFEWMVAIAYFREAIPEAYRHAGLPQRLFEEIEASDGVIAPIADNRMFALLSLFFRDQITDEEALHSFAAIHLGEQYVMKSEKATRSLRLLSCFFVSDAEREHFKKQREDELLRKEGEREQIHLSYGRQGHYWSELWPTL
jgi:AcrR family transcriptional regulator